MLLLLVRNYAYETVAAVVKIKNGNVDKGDREEQTSLSSTTFAYFESQRLATEHRV